jgi:5-methylcytosine-specific restriction endonuclease McrA
MNTNASAVAQLSEFELLEHFEALVARDRRNTAQLLVAIAEIDERKLWARHACPSMFVFCVERFHMSEQVAAKRIWAARTARRFPIVLEMVERGELHLSAIHLLARHLTPQNCSEVLRRARHKSAREIERLVAELAPRPDVSSSVRALPRTVVDATQAGCAANASSGDSTMASASATEGVRSASAPAAAMRSSSVLSPAGSPGPTARPITALSPRRYKIEITIDEATHDKLRSPVGREPAAIVSRAIDVLLADTLKRKAATTERPRPAAPARGGSSQQSTRRIPAALRRAVWQRDCGRCCYVNAEGRRCNATSNVEFHHKIPFARGGCHDANNVELRCASHNQYQADLDFGRGFMNARRGRAAPPMHSAGNVA